MVVAWIFGLCLIDLGPVSGELRRCRVDVGWYLMDFGWCRIDLGRCQVDLASVGKM